MIVEQSRLVHLTGQERRAALAFVERLRQRFDGELVSAILFGSRARGEANPDSDMDVLVVLSSASPEIRKQVRYLAVEVWLEHGVYLSTRVWDQAHWSRQQELRTSLYKNISRDGIQLLAPASPTS